MSIDGVSVTRSTCGECRRRAQVLQLLAKQNDTVHQIAVEEYGIIAQIPLGRRRIKSLVAHLPWVRCPPNCWYWVDAAEREREREIYVLT